MNVKKVVVLASNSFTGAHFVDHVLSHTDAQVLGFSRSPEYDPLFLPYRYRKPLSSRFRFQQLDVNTQMEMLLRRLDEERPDVIVNLAAQGEVRNSWKWPEQWFETNTMAVVRLANALRTRDYLKRYVAISTPEVYGATGEGITENNSFSPSTPYAASKLAGDLFLMTLWKSEKFPVVYTRAANLYGIHQQLYRIIPRTIIYVKLGRKIQLHGGGQSVRAFIHARDVADATWRAITQGRSGEVYHLAPSGEQMRIRDLVASICQMMARPFEDSVELIEENFGQDAMYSLDASKARRELGWTPSVRLQDGIQEMITWIDQNWDAIRQQPLDYVHKR